ncbi:MAG: MBL fold metallo-hydrolase [Candidatus Altiarchaeota archaeon]|nr:MBL fold metallo-hydrolase [Candidatus Altiarchaeota archaeon]
MKLSFHGATKIVTGSCFLLETGKSRILVDCGMFQGTKDVTRRNYDPFRFDPKTISHVLLTHAHIDHSGLLPKLVAAGFRGRILATSATIDLCRIMLEDSVEVMRSETEHENKRRVRQGLPARSPLYTMKEVEATMPLFDPVEYGETYPVTGDIQARYLDAGHIIGSASIEAYVGENATTKKIVFSGDIGQWNTPIIRDPTLIDEADYLVMESTYGNRLHDEIALRDDAFLKCINETYAKGGKLLIPSFAVERTQELLYALSRLSREGRLPDEPVYLDSPLAIKATEVFRSHREFFDKEAFRYADPFGFPNLVYSHTTEESKKLNDFNGPCIIIAGNGMVTGGRIRHHFRHGLSNPRNTALFVGYQAEGTLGRKILEGAERVKMMGLKIDVKAEIRVMNSFSAHADYRELLKWADGFRKKPRKVYVVHGEKESSESLKEKLEEKGFTCHIPEMGETAEL